MEENRENKYEVVDPDTEKYRLTGEDLKKEKKQKKKKKHRALRVLLILLLIFALLMGGCAAFVNSYLSKVNYGDMEAEVDPQLDVEEAIEFEGQAEADAEIKKNLSDNVMWYDDRVFNVLLVGYDLGDLAVTYFPRSDSMTLISINTVTNSINMVSLSRATYVAIEGHGNKRINTAHAYGGAKMLVDTIQKNYKIRVDRYITVDFSGFTDIIDILGGVDISMTAAEGKAMNKGGAGTYHLNGAEALAYSRLRWIDSDRARTGRQRAVLTAIANQFRHSSVQTLANLLDDFLPLVTTNFSKVEILSQMTKAYSYLTMNIHEDIIPHIPVSLSVRDGMEVLILNWANEKNYLHNLLYPNMTPQSHEEN